MKGYNMKNTITMKARRADERYIKTFQTCGNKKLTDYTDENGNAYRYAMFNLPAKRTCPFATDGCKRFCYAKRDERYPSARYNRENNLEISKRDDFAARLIYTIESELESNRYNGATMILRIHESGDFYNFGYLAAWLEVFRYFMSDSRVMFCFYTKCFKYFMALDNDSAATLTAALSNGRVAMSLSYDETMSGNQAADLAFVKARFPLANVYAAIPGDNMETFAHDEVCDCADCAKCGKCTHATGKVTACAIH